MEYLYKDLRHLEAGSTVVISLSSQANVQLMTNSEFLKYKSGLKYTYYGGKAMRTPIRLNVPRTDHWVVAIDLGSYGGRLSATVQVEA